ncbi:hypothetical protein F5J12DRAFT_782774 [Pisolithus orientalis]|uniref:uncharacterized protein n=1 Tax=Pisolithus orientalis TaxID=936130 RepID=UPI00222561D3|nr:uncharacterized protein F5J12DRAFT_782774 [Pisolithus orientalis]KAI6006478.1 hypothetical protein F5J12DRAFT_782774 [Pisolithus orientalis]
MGIPGGFGEDLQCKSSALIGGLVSAMLYGIATLQTYVYYMQYPEDASATKLLVAAICCHSQIRQITNYGIPASLGYIVWSFQASVLVHVLVVAVVQCLSPSREVVGDRPSYAINTGSDWVWHGFVIHKTSALTQISVIPLGEKLLYVLTPAFAIIVLTEVLITVSLCVLFYSSRSDSAFPSTKRLLNTLIIYAVNRCGLIQAFHRRLVAIGELAVAFEHQDAWIMALDLVAQGSSLNTRQYLRSQVSGTLSDLRISTVRFANPPRLPEHEETTGDSARLFGIHEGPVIEVTINPAHGKTMVLRREGEV